MKLLLRIAFVLSVLVAAALAAIPFIVTPDAIARQIASTVAEQTGRELRMGGEPSFSYWPELGVSLTDVALTNPPGMAEGHAVHMDQLTLRVALLPLLSGAVEVAEFVVEHPRLDLVIDAQGRSNWTLEQDDRQGEQANTQAPQLSGETSSGGFGVTSVTLAPIRIVNGSLRYLDERSGTAFSADAVDVTLELPDLESALDVEGSLVWNGERVDVSANATSPVALAGGGMSPIDLALHSRLITSAFSGRASLSSGFSLAGHIDVGTQSLREFAKWAGNPLAPGKGLAGFQVDGELRLDGQTVTFEGADVMLDDMRGSGTMRTELGGDRPKLVASLDVDRIDLDTYLGAGSAGGNNSSAPQPVGDGAGADGWSTERIDFSGLKAVDADLDLVASEIVHGDIVTGRVALDLSLDGGVLNARLSELDLYGGKAAGMIVLDGARQVPAVRLDFSAEDFNGYKLLRDLGDFEWLEGTATSSISLAAVGRSQRDLVSSLQGSAGFTFADGAVRGINVAGMIRGVSENILLGWEETPAEKTDFSLFQANFTIDQGRAVNHDLQLLGPLVRVTGEGTVDLPARTLDYRVNPRLVASIEGQGGDAGLSGIGVPVAIRGDWSDPNIYPDIEGVLQDPQAVYDQIKGLVGVGNYTGLEDGMDSLQEDLRSTVGRELESLLGPGAGNAESGQGGRFLDGLFGTRKQAEDGEDIEQATPATEMTVPPGTTDEQNEIRSQDIAPSEPDPGSYLDEESREMFNQKLDELFRSDDSEAID